MTRPSGMTMDLVQGNSGAETFTMLDSGTPINLTSPVRTYRLHVRTDPKSTSPIFAMSCDAVTAGASGIMTASYTQGNTALLTPGQQYYWDLEETVSGGTETLCGGMLNCIQPITH